MGAWRTSLEARSADLILGPSARAASLRDAETELGLELPAELRDLLRDVDGVTATTCSPVWPLNRIVVDNRALRSDADLAASHMALDSLLFFGDDADGHLYAHPIQGGAAAGTAIYRWHRDTDDRTRVADGLQEHLDRVIAALPVVEPEPVPVADVEPEPVPVAVVEPEPVPVAVVEPEPAPVADVEPETAPTPVADGEPIKPVKPVKVSRASKEASVAAVAAVKPVRVAKTPAGPPATATSSSADGGRGRVVAIAAAIVVVLGFAAGLTFALTRSGSSSSTTASGAKQTSSTAAGGAEPGASERDGGAAADGGRGPSTSSPSSSSSSSSSTTSATTTTTTTPDPVASTPAATGAASTGPVVPYSPGLPPSSFVIQGAPPTTIAPALLLANPSAGLVHIPKGGKTTIRITNRGGRPGQFYLQSNGVVKLSTQSGTLAPGASTDVVVTAAAGAEGASVVSGALEGAGIYSVTIFIDNVPGPKPSWLTTTTTTTTKP